MQVPYDEGVANHIDPESCAGFRAGVCEALTGSAQAKLLNDGRTAAVQPDGLVHWSVPFASVFWASCLANALRISSREAVMSPVELGPKPASWGKTNHIQRVRLRPLVSSSVT